MLPPEALGPLVAPYQGDAVHLRDDLVILCDEQAVNPEPDKFHEGGLHHVWDRHLWNTRSRVVLQIYYVDHKRMLRN